MRRYVAATGDTEFERGPGLELLVETARLWRSLGHHDAEGCFRIDGVTGPDEYTALVDNNVFTNLMAARNLRAAADVASRYPERAAELGVDAARDRLRGATPPSNIVVPFDDELGVTAQSEGFTRYRRWDFEATRAEEYPLLLHYPVLPALLESGRSSRPISSSPSTSAATTSLPNRSGATSTTTRRSRCATRRCRRPSRRSSPPRSGISTSPTTTSASRPSSICTTCAGNTADGLHLASLAGAWLVAVAGFGGMRDYGDTLAFAPRLPPALTRLSFRLVYRGRRLRIEIGPDHARYELLAGEPLDLLHHGEPFTLAPASPQTLACPAPPEPPPVEPPPGRAAGQHGVGRRRYQRSDDSAPESLTAHVAPTSPASCGVLRWPVRARLLAESVPTQELVDRGRADSSGSSSVQSDG